MDITSQISLLRASFGLRCEILTDPKDAMFRDLIKRWSDIDLQIPAAIVLPTLEVDCQNIVRWAVSQKPPVPFVTKSGGHSEWSTIGKNGIVIDLSRYSGIEVDADSQTATLTGSVLSKEVAVRLAEAGMFTALGNGNTVGAMGYFLGGGVPTTPSLTGFGSDQIVSARMITAQGNLVDVTEEQHPDLLYAIRGAGQFFGLVTQLVIRAHPLSALGNDKGVIWAGAFVYSLDNAKEVCSVMKTLMDDNRYGTAGLMMVAAPPPANKPSLVIAARFTGDPKQASKAYKPLYDCKPIVANGGEVPIQNTSDNREAICAKGDFKRFGVVGLHRFEPDAFLKVIDLWKAMIAECPDSINSAFMFQWDSRPVRTPDFESAMCLHDIRYWENNLIWHTDPKNRAKVDEYNAKSIAIMRGTNDVRDFVDYQNGTRTGPIEKRYRGKERLDRLKSLKKLWDPKGVFTRQLLDP